MTVRQEIIKSGRMDLISEFIGEVLLINDADYPVDLRYNDDWTTATSRVNMKKVREGIVLWILFIDMENTVSIPDSQRELLDDFSRLVDSRLEMELHNYAVECSHRINPTEESMEHIRALSVLSSSIQYILYNLDTDERDFIPFEIPSGWKKGGD